MTRQTENKLLVITTIQAIVATTLTIVGSGLDNWWLFGLGLAGLVIFVLTSMLVIGIIGISNEDQRRSS